MLYDILNQATLVAGRSLCEQERQRRMLYDILNQATLVAGR
jgi:hypothetical protein